MKTICERCSRSFDAATNCPHCGAFVETQDGNLQQESRTVWGWATISLNVEHTLREASLQELKAEWLRLEEFTVLQLLHSQAKAFEEGQDCVRVFVRRDLLGGLIDRVRALRPQVSVKFQAVDGEFSDATAANVVLASRSMR